MKRKIVWMVVGALGLVSGACGDDATTAKSSGAGVDVIGGEADFATFPPVDTNIGDGGGPGTNGDTVTKPVGDGGISPTDADIGPFDAGPEPGAFLYKCTSNTQCDSGFCVLSEQGKVCTKVCVDTCPTGWSCNPVQVTGGDLTYVCMSRFVNLCRPCATDDECNQEFEQGTNSCIDFQGNGHFCGVACADNDECAEGYSCDEVQLASGAVSKQCVPSSGECVCSDTYIKQQSTTECYYENSYGKCEGSRTCGPDGLTDCSATVPAPEVCNGKDDNCDGEIDPPKAGNCIDWYVDVDDDGYGIGVPQCLCEAPAPGYVDKGGDCNDSNVMVNPDAVEACNGIDDNCDSKIDEADSEGCSTYSPDADGDGFGSNTELVCLCAKGPGVTTTKGDCDDGDKEVNPDASEVCDGVDNDCDGQTDEEDAEGCEAYYFDQDKDGYGLSDKVKCLCQSEEPYSTTNGGDCDDNKSKVAPFMDELCDGVDNNCDGTIDEGDPVQVCGTVKNGTPACLDGECVVKSCDGGFYDINFEIDDGCECKAAVVEQSGTTCEKAFDLGNVPDSKKTVEVQGNAVYVDESDWYRFKGSDGPDTNGCDSYHVRVQFKWNPGFAYTFDVYRGSCASANQLCKQGTDFDWYTNFLEGDLGECKCTDDPNKTSAEIHDCTNNTSDYYIRVYRNPDKEPSCEGYSLEITNGVY